MSVNPNYSASQAASEALRQELLIRSLIGDIRTAIPVKVIAVHPGEGTPPEIGTVDVQPLVQTVDGSGKLWSIDVTYGAKFNRLQSGSTALILDPSAGDIGLAVASDRDISSVIASAGLAAPGSARTHDISDLTYLFSIISTAAITQYLQMSAALLKAIFPNINLNGVTISNSGTLAAPVVQSGNGASGTYTIQNSTSTITIADGIVTNVT